jgi:hypothetical protein
LNFVSKGHLLKNRAMLTRASKADSLE